MPSYSHCNMLFFFFTQACKVNTIISNLCVRCHPSFCWHSDFVSIWTRNLITILYAFNESSNNLRQSLRLNAEVVRTVSHNLKRNVFQILASKLKRLNNGNIYTQYIFIVKFNFSSLIRGEMLSAVPKKVHFRQYSPTTRPGDLVVPDPFGHFFGWFQTLLDHIGPIWTNLNHSVCLDQSFWTRLFRTVYLDLSIWTCIFGPVSLDLSLWTRLFGPVY